MEKSSKPSPKIIIETILATGMTQVEAAEHFNVSTRWIRTLQARYRDGGIKTLEPRSKRPRTNPGVDRNPAEIKPDHDYRLRADKVGTNGKTTLRWGGKLRRLYIGRRWGGQPITMVCVDNHVDIKITATGAQIAAYTLTEEKIYYNKKDNKLSPQRGN